MIHFIFLHPTDTPARLHYFDETPLHRNSQLTVTEAGTDLPRDNTPDPCSYPELECCSELERVQSVRDVQNSCVQHGGLTDYSVDIGELADRVQLSLKCFNQSRSRNTNDTQDSKPVSAQCPGRRPGTLEVRKLWKMLFRRWLAMALGVFWLTLWTHFLGVDAGKKVSSHNYGQDYSDESSEWDWKVRISL